MEQSLKCPHCLRRDRQVRAGLNGGNQRYKCGYCLRRYTPVARPRGYPANAQQIALEMHAQGLSHRQIAQQIGSSPRSVGRWLAGNGAIPTLEDSGAENNFKSIRSADPVMRASRRPTIHDVAAHTGVSVSTVSNYLNKKGRMSEPTRARIKAAVEALHFAPNFHVRAIRQHRTRIIGVVMFGLGELDENPGGAVTPPLLTGIDRAAAKVRHNILLYTDTGWAGYPDSIEDDRLLDGHIDGLIWTAPRMDEPIIEKVAKAGVPLVALLARHVPESVGFVNLDNIGAMDLLVKHLVAEGRSRIAFLGPAQESNWVDRRDGYRLAIKSAGLEWNEGLEATGPNEQVWEREFYLEGIDTWLAQRTRPDAIITADDGYAALAINRVFERGLRIPEDIAITGFNDVPFTKSFAGGITTIRQDFRQIGEIGVERLIALVEGAPVADCRVTLPPQLLVRASTIGGDAAHG